MNIQTSDKNHFTEGIIYASETRRDETTKIVAENHALQQAFLNELDEKLKGVLQLISGFSVNEDTLHELIIPFSDTNFTRPNYNTYDVQRDVNISLVCTGDPADLLGKWVLVHVGFAMSVIDEDEAKKTQEALLAMSQLEHEVGDFLGLNQK